jgi:hypothetical protein
MTYTWAAKRANAGSRACSGVLLNLRRDATIRAGFTAVPPLREQGSTGPTSITTVPAAIVASAHQCSRVSGRDRYGDEHYIRYDGYQSQQRHGHARSDLPVEVAADQPVPHEQSSKDEDQHTADEGYPEGLHLVHGRPGSPAPLRSSRISDRRPGPVILTGGRLSAVYRAAHSLGNEATTRSKNAVFSSGVIAWALRAMYSARSLASASSASQARRW